LILLASQTGQQKLEEEKKMKVNKVFFHGYKSGKMLGFADIQFSIFDGDEGLITIKGWKVFQNDDGISVQAPATKKDGKTGPEYFPTIMFSKDSVADEFVNEINIRVAKAVDRASSKPDERPTKKSETKREQPKQHRYDVDDEDPF
jgi:hypothetical protein